jgi:hypothetical protein
MKMIDPEAPVFGLSVRQYKELTRQIVAEEIAKVILQQNPKSPAQNEDTIFIVDVMRITGYKKNTVYTKVSRLQIPYLSRCRPLTFSKDAIIQWIKSGKPGYAQ